MTTGFSETGHRYQLIVRGECGPLTEWLSGDAAIETGNGCTNLIFSARDDSELYVLLDRIQDLGLDLITLDEAGGTEAVPHLPRRASLAHPGASPLDGRGTPNPPWGPAVLPRAAPAIPAARRERKANVHPHRYRISIGGGLSTVVRQAFEGFAIESNGVYTTLIADLDQAALYGTLNRIQSLDLDLIEVTRTSAATSSV